MVLCDSTKIPLEELESTLGIMSFYLSAVTFMGFVSDSCSHVFSDSCITKNLSSVSTSGSIRYQPDEHASLIELPSEQFSVGNHIKPSEQQLMSIDAWPREIVNVSRPIHSRPKKKKKRRGNNLFTFDCEISLVRRIILIAHV